MKKQDNRDFISVPTLMKETRDLPTAISRIIWFYSTKTAVPLQTAHWATKRQVVSGSHHHHQNQWEPSKRSVLGTQRRSLYRLPTALMRTRSTLLISLRLFSQVVQEKMSRKAWRCQRCHQQHHLLVLVPLCSLRQFCLTKTRTALSFHRKIWMGPYPAASAARLPRAELSRAPCIPIASRRLLL